MSLCGGVSMGLRERYLGFDVQRTFAVCRGHRVSDIDQVLWLMGTFNCRLGVWVSLIEKDNDGCDVRLYRARVRAWNDVPFFHLQSQSRSEA